MDPEIWGSGLWLFLHTIAINYPKEPTAIDKKNMYNFLSSLTTIIPCEKCRLNYIKHINELPISSHLDNRNDLFQWTVEMHNMVNKELNKPIMTLDDAITEYKNIYLNKDKYSYYKKISDNVDNSVDTIVNNANHNLQYTNTNKNKNKFKINYKYVIIVLLCIIGIILFLYNNI